MDWYWIASWSLNKKQPDQIALYQHLKAYLIGKRLVLFNPVFTKDGICSGKKLSVVAFSRGAECEADVGLKTELITGRSPVRK